MNMNSNNMIKVWSLWPLRHHQRICILPGESFPGLQLTHPAWAPACCRVLQSLPQIRLRSADWLSQSGVFHIFTPRRFFGCSYSAVLLNDEMWSNVFWSIWLNLSTLSAPAHPCIHPVASIRGEIINKRKCGTSVGSCTGGGSHNRTSTMFDRWGDGFRSRAPPTTPNPPHTHRHPQHTSLTPSCWSRLIPVSSVTELFLSQNLPNYWFWHTSHIWHLSDWFLSSLLSSSFARSPPYTSYSSTWI